MSAKYYLYRNLHKGAFSIRHRGRVVVCCESVLMDNVEFRVSEVGRQRVIAEQVKNVHAFVVADEYYRPSNLVLAGYERQICDGYFKEVTYNPYNNSTFFIKKTNEAITHADWVLCMNEKVYITGE